jgi:hypothetical protein
MKSARPVLPAVGDVIRYAYLWSHESGAGREEGTKDRPAAIVALLRGDDGRDEVVVFPITSSPPTDAAAGVEIPVATRDSGRSAQRLGRSHALNWTHAAMRHWINGGDGSITQMQQPPKTRKKSSHAPCAPFYLRKPCGH